MSGIILNLKNKRMTVSRALTDAQKIARLRCSLANKASNVIKNRYIDEYQEIYWKMLREHGLQPTTNSSHMVLLTEENKKLKELLRQQGVQA